MNRYQSFTFFSSSGPSIHQMNLAGATFKQKKYLALHAVCGALWQKILQLLKMNAATRDSCKSIWGEMGRRLLSLQNCMRLRKSSELKKAGSFQAVKEKEHICSWYLHICPGIILAHQYAYGLCEKQDAELGRSLIWPSKVIHVFFFTEK